MLLTRAYKQVKILSENDVEVRMRKHREQIIFSVSRSGKIIFGGCITEEMLPRCAYCHERIHIEAKKVGALIFHWHCYLRFFNWQRENECPFHVYWSRAR